MRSAFSRWTKTGALTLSLVTLITGAVITSASAQNVFTRREQVIYDGNPLNAANVKVGSWGSGVCEESTQNTYSGSRSLKITPKDLFTGGRVDFLAPVDITSSFGSNDTFIQLVTQFKGTQDKVDSWAQGVSTSSDIYGGTATPGKQIKKVRVVLYFENGGTIEFIAPVSAYKLADDGWMTISAPMVALKGKLNLPNYKLKRMVITGDGTEPFNVGEIRVVKDSTPLTADAGGDKEVSKNYPIAFQAVTTAGASAVKYSWDFDKTNGIQEEGTGDLVYHRFTKAGYYDVTLTVSDIFGQKQPVSTIIKVKVNE